MVLTIVVDSVFSIIFTDDNVAQLVARFVLIVIMLLVNVTVFKLKFGNMMNRIGLGLLLLLPGLSYVVLNLIGVEFDNLMKASMQAYLIAVVSTIAAVSYEEILLRGLLLNGLLKAWSQKKNGIFVSCYMVKCALLISACYKLTFWRTFRCNFITAYLYNSNGLPLRGCVFKNKQSINTNYRSLRDKFQWCITRYGHRSRESYGSC